MTLRLYYGDALAHYGFGAGHPFGPDRLGAFWKECTARGLDRRALIAAPVQASEADLLRFHTHAYVERVKLQSQTGEGFLDYGDTPAFPGVYEAAATVVGSTLDAVAHAVSGAARRAFVPIAGLHHARREMAAGFCVFNDIGCAIEALRAVHGVHRIAYVDIDAHHGDGVYYAFADDPELIFADLHEDGRFLYPARRGIRARRPARNNPAAGRGRQHRR
jgi:acetoin utilization protein AcuC